QQDGNRKQTPRLYLRILGQALRNEVMPPFTSVETLSGVKSPTAWFAQTTTHSGDLEKLLKWYGRNTNQGVFLARQIAMAFDVSVPTETEIIGGFYRFDLRPGGKEILPPPPSHLRPKEDKPKLSITRVEPREGLTRMANTIRVEGTNFQNGSKARLGELLLATSFLSPTQLQATVPTALPLGTHHLTIINPDRSQTTYANAYTVKEQAAPSLLNLQPNAGEANQSNEIYLQGTNFQKGCQVSLGDTTLNTIYLEPTQLRATVPANLPSGTYDVTVTNPDRRGATLFKVYTIKPEDLFGQLDQWLERQGRFPGRTAFKDGIWKLLEMFQFNPFVLQHPYSIANKGTPLIYSRGDRSSQIYLHDSADALQAGYLKLTIHPQKEFRDLYSQILAIGQGHYK
ncbi:MAG: IPT/TIG domain-containing protein, partial [Bdellovibrionales bacterium]|nr:IPT/TIG domain-containing protein [Bdellovibrionales bacterium]